MSNDMEDVTVNPIELIIEASLKDYSQVQKITSNIKLEMVDPCLDTVLTFEETDILLESYFALDIVEM